MFLERKEPAQFQLEENRETAGASMGVQVFQQEKTLPSAPFLSGLKI